MADLKNKDIEISLNKFPDNVRIRPGMYVGDPDTAGDILIREIIDNSLDEIFSGYGDKLLVYTTKTTKDNTYIVIDNGRGIPTTKSKENPEMTMAELAMSQLHAGSKFHKDEVAIGMNGVGASAVNALSNEFIILTKIDRKRDNTDFIVSELKNYNKSDVVYYLLKFNKGVFTEHKLVNSDFVKEFYKTKRLKSDINLLSTLISFEIDDSIIKNKVNVNLTNLQYFIYCNQKFYKKESEIIIDDHKLKLDSKIFNHNYCEIQKFKQNDVSVNKELDLMLGLTINDEIDKALQLGCVNTLEMNKGCHIKWTMDLLEELAVNEFSIEKKFINRFISSQIVILAPEITNDSQTKEKLSKIANFDYEKFSKLYTRSVRAFFKENQDTLDAIKEVIKEIIKVSVNSSLKQKLNSIIASDKTSTKYLPAKLRDVSNINNSNTELIIVEGDSAAGGIVKMRDPLITAVFPLTGKPMNVADKNEESLVGNQELIDVINCLGAGIDVHKTSDKPRYDRIIICADPDPDGFNISALVIGALAKFCKFLFEEERVYILCCPLYHQNGKYFQPNEEHLLDKNKPITRFKGLGEMNSDQVYDTLLDPNIRVLKKITLDDYVEANKLLSASADEKKKLMMSLGVLVTK